MEFTTAYEIKALGEDLPCRARLISVLILFTGEGKVLSVYTVVILMKFKDCMSVEKWESDSNKNQIKDWY